MSVSTDYSTPVMVNGYACKNCTDVGNAKKHIDPEHPRSGPYGINAKNDPSTQQNAAIEFGGALAGLKEAAKNTSQEASKSSSDGAAPRPPVPGAQLDLTV